LIGVAATSALLAVVSGRLKVFDSSMYGRIQYIHVQPARTVALQQLWLGPSDPA
jgi:hypothetical protein